MPTTSEPVLGSVMAKKPMDSPLTQPGMKRSFCSLVPNLLTVMDGPMFCMLKGTRHEPETLAICSARMTDSKIPKPLPPYSSSTAQPKKPFSPIFLRTSGRNLWFFSSSSRVGRISFSAKFFAVSCIILCSSVSPNCISGSRAIVLSTV